MSPSLRLCGAWCLVALCTVLTVQVSAARHLRGGVTASDTVSADASQRGFSRKLTACNGGCSNILATATIFGVLASQSVSNNGPSYVFGEVGVYPGSSITGFNESGGGQASGGYHKGDDMSVTAQSDAHIGYAYLKGLTFDTDLTGKELGGLTLYPGVYRFAGSAHLSANLTLDAQGNESAIFVFQTVSTFITSSATNVLNVNGTQSCNVFFQVGSSATLGTYSSLAGNVVAHTTIVVGHGAIIDGSLLAIGAAVVLDTDGVSAPGQCSDAPDSPTAPPMSPSPNKAFPSPPPPPPPPRSPPPLPPADN